MSKLILKRFKCLVETDEIGADSPYFLTFVGDIASGNTHIKMTRQGNWHNEVDQGETWTVNETVADGFNFIQSKTVVLSAMVEEDEGVDINSNEVESIRLILKAKLDQHRGTGSNVVTDLIRNSMASAMRSAMTIMLLTASGDGDDIVAVGKVKLNNTTGEQSVVTLTGDGGKYQVRYAVA